MFESITKYDIVPVVRTTTTATKQLFTHLLHFKIALKDKSRIGIIVDYSRDYTVVNGVQ